jgi:hypothetical protein
MEEKNGCTECGAPKSAYKKRLCLSFTLFAVFFVFYMGTAIINTPSFSNVASIPFLGMPLGMTLSLAVFPVSWVLGLVFYFKWK